MPFHFPNKNTVGKYALQKLTSDKNFRRLSIMTIPRIISNIQFDRCS